MIMTMNKEKYNREIDKTNKVQWQDKIQIKCNKYRSKIEIVTVVTGAFHKWQNVVLVVTVMNNLIIVLHNNETFNKDNDNFYLYDGKADNS